MPDRECYGKELSVSLLEEIAAGFAGAGGGKVADYIPELARVKSGVFSISCAARDGRIFEAGEAEHSFTMQSIAKIFILSLAIEAIGGEEVFRHVGMEPSADSFNSLMRLEMTSRKPSNPFINSGAIVMSSLLLEKYGANAFDEVCGMAASMTGTYPDCDRDVLASESLTADRNRSLAYFLRSMGFVSEKVEDFLHLYFKCCSLRCTTSDLARAASVLSFGGLAADGRRILKKETVYILLGLMSSCGLYNGSGEFAVRVGLSGKSGVSGGILAAAPGYMGIGVYAPALDDKGNSVAGVAALEKLSDILDLRGSRRA